MLQMIVKLYIKSLGLSAVVVGLACLLWLGLRLLRRVDKTPQEGQLVVYDMLMIMIVTIPILSFGLVAILMMKQV